MAKYNLLSYLLIFQFKPNHLNKNKSESWQQSFGTRFYYERLAASSAVVYSVKKTCQLTFH